jgi:hypothetical protein
MLNNKYISVLGNITATTFQIDSNPDPEITTLVIVNRITGDTDRLEIGMTIVFLSTVGGLTAGTQYYIISDGFTSTQFKVGTSLDSSAVTLTDSSRKVSYIAYKEFSSVIPTPSLIIDSATSTVTVDYSDQLTNLSAAVERLTNAFETSDSSKFADNVQRYVTLADGEGIHMKGPLDWLGYVSSYKLYVENVGPENVTLEGLIAYKAKIDALPKEF